MTIHSASGSWVPDACTLPTAAQPLRVAEFDRFFAAYVLRSTRPERTRLELHIPVGAIAPGKDLARREVACCSFFTFDFDLDASGPVLRIEVPPTRVDVLDAVQDRVQIAVGQGDSR
ncbi:hypothetical protein [Nocardia altamirensis]|uniref:hypothetical protein n=1 Tax=Nocardia altamirensis TaxID=472158 RepID=UPI00084094EE|nr:hypothetical protein [Nocardia altamirensis]